jgi:uncharacterized protein involved in exopolysaccharide biosynthesis
MTNEIDLRDYFDVLIRRWQIVAAMPILAALAAALVTFTLKPTYEATATVALAPSTISVLISTQQPPYYLLVDSPRHLPTAFTPAYYVSVLQSADVVNVVTPRLPVTISPSSADKSLIEITARGDDPKAVAQVVNAWAQVGAAHIQRLLQPTGDEVTAAKQKLDTAQQALDQFARDNKIDYDFTDLHGLPRDKELELQALMRERDTAESVYLDFARDFERSVILANSANRPTPILASVPTTPISPKLAQNVLIGAAFGLLLGILGAFAVEFVSHRPPTAR